jgi:hypothetical protein
MQFADSGQPTECRGTGLGMARAPCSRRLLKGKRVASMADPTPLGREAQARRSRRYRLVSREWSMG